MRLLGVERRWVATLFAGILPPGNRRLPHGAREARVVEFFEEHLGYLPVRTRWALRGAVDLASGLARVHPRGAAGVLEWLDRSPVYALREVITLLKSVVCLGYFTDEDVRRALGLDLTLATVGGRS
jgi:hypothetical protein